MKRVAMILAVLVGLAFAASPAMAYYPNHHYHRTYYPTARYGVNYVPSYGVNVGIGVPGIGFNYSAYPAYGYGYGYPGYGVRYGYPGAVFASPQSFGYGPGAIFGY